jgi:nitrogen regulatory protein P-II 1
MKRIEAVIRRDRLSEVKLAMAAVPHHGLTACDMTEQDSRCGTVLLCRGTKRVDDMTPRVGVTVLVDAADAGAAVDAIVGAARTGHDGDGMVVVVPVEQVVRISSPVAVA